MKKFLIATTLSLLVGLLLITPALAQLGNQQLMNNLAAEAGLANTELVGVINKIVRIVMTFLGLIAVIIIIIGGFQWMTSGGNEEKIAGAKKLMGAGIVGLVIVVLAYAIAAFVINTLFSVTNTNTQ